MSTISLVYLIDCYTDVSCAAQQQTLNRTALTPLSQIIGPCLVGVSFMRNGLATVMIFCFAPWVNGVGFQNTFIMCACIAAASFATVIPMIVWGKSMRVKTAVKYRKAAMF